MTDYGQHFSTRTMPVASKARAEQVVNSTGGFVFAVDKWTRLNRWLVLGAEEGTYYASERELVVDNAKALQECLAEDGARTVKTIVEISDAGRAPKNDPAIFALAMAAGHENAETRRLALDALPKVRRIGTHLFHFARDVSKFRGWGPSLKRAIGNWYTSRSTDALARQIVKYQNRDGWGHKDVLRLAHVVAKTPEQDTIFRWVVDDHQIADLRSVKRGKGGPEKSYAVRAELPVFMAAYAELFAAKDKATVVRLIREHGFTHEMLPTEWKNEADVWEALLEEMPQTALIRNLAKMTAVGLLKPMSAAAKLASERIADTDRLRKARVHPISILSALRVYQQGHGEKGSLTWSPVGKIVDALDEAFYLAFGAVEPIGKPVLLALDISGSMSTGTIAGIPGLTPRDVSAAMAMVTARTEKDYAVVGFSDTLRPLNISPKQRLDDVIRTISGLPFAYTDCSLPFSVAQREKWQIDSFQVFTDNETNSGTHPFQALRRYRESSGRRATLAVAAVTATNFTIADPSDAGMLDVCGFDSAAPQIISDFARSA